jgi:hypothetical protein
MEMIETSKEYLFSGKELPEDVFPCINAGRCIEYSVFETSGFTSNANIYSPKYLLYWAYSILV